MKCRSCPAEIVWARTAAGKMMPVDKAPNENGNLILTYGDRNADVRVQGADDPPGLRHTSHFATCANANKHRRSK